MPIAKILIVADDGRKMPGTVPAKVWATDLEEEAEAQIYNVMQLPFIHHHVAIMPDAHWGMGCTIGSVIPTKKAIIPSAVGVDIGCGMMAVKTSLNAADMPESLRQIRLDIEREVPAGMGNYQEHTSKFKPYIFVLSNDLGIEDDLERGFKQLLWNQDNIFSEKVVKNWRNQIGTLGGGNHFIEICLDEHEDVWVMLHSGSRGVGNQIGRYFIELAKKDMQKWMINLPDKNLAYLPEGTEHFDAYWEAVKWAQDFAFINRQEMMDNIFGVLLQHFPQIKVTDTIINCHHNYVTMENHFGQNVYVIRKGAIRAREGDRGIIPGSMGTKSFIVIGKGNAESFHSCSHGAGRKMSRTKAKQSITQEEFKKQVEGIECDTRASRIDEAPGAYKDIDVVMSNQSDLVEIEYTLKQILCIKGD